MKRVFASLVMVAALAGCRGPERVPCQDIPKFEGMEVARVVKVDVCDSDHQCAVVIQRQNGDWAYVGVDGLIRENQMIFRACHLKGSTIEGCDPVWSNQPTMPHGLDIDPVVGASDEPSDAAL